MNELQVSNNQRPCSTGEHEILMEITAKDGQKQIVKMDTPMLSYLNKQLEKIEQTFPRCYVYKKNSNTKNGN